MTIKIILLLPAVSMVLASVAFSLWQMLVDPQVGPHGSMSAQPD